MKKELPKRKNIRLKDYDYSEKGNYFITICTKNKENILNKIQIYNCRGGNLPPVQNKLMYAGKIAEKYLIQMQNIYKNIEINNYVIMPNHIHFILEIKSQRNNYIQQMIGQYKRNVSIKLELSIWQKSYYEHIVRDEKEYYKIIQYIQDNPQNWNKDKYF